tara:strand:+ start:202 stop:903 length:702 start_codon:yes stop_codon:yes gene_type:complete
MNIKVSNVSKLFNNKNILNSISFDISSGETACLLGNNGSGKTTLFKILSFVTSMDGGSIKFNNITASSFNIKCRSYFTFVGHSLGFYSGLSAFDNLKLISKLHGISYTAKQLNDFLELVSLKEYSKKRVRDFSKGMQQRLKIIIPDLLNTPIIFLDEPFTALDLHGVNLLKSNIMKWKSLGKTIIISTHDAKWAMTIADKIILLDEGKLKINEKISQINKENIFNEIIRMPSA